MLKYSFVVVFILATACGEEEETKPIDPAALQGTWLSSCLASSDQYEQKSVKFEGAEFTMISSRYSDAACTSAVDQLKGSGLYGVVAVDATKSDMTPSFINYLFESVSWTFISDPSAAVDYAPVCDSTAVDGVVDLLDKTCAIRETVTVEFSSKAYGIVEIKDAKLLITDFDGNSSTPDYRPKQYPSLEGFTLQVVTPEG